MRQDGVVSAYRAFFDGSRPGLDVVGSGARRGVVGAGVSHVPGRARDRSDLGAHARGLRAAAADDQGQLPPAPSAARAVPGRAARRLRHDRGVVGLDRHARPSGRARSSTSCTSPGGSSRSSATGSARTAAARSRSCASRWAPGWADCSPPPACGTWRPRATRSPWSRRATTRREILRVILPELAPHFDQVVLLGYPPFVKDVIDTAVAGWLDWPSYAMKLVLAGEVFSEEWRDLVAGRAGDRRSGHATRRRCTAPRTPACSATRRRCRSRSAGSSRGRPDLARELFGDSRLPTLVAVRPGQPVSSRRSDGTLLFSGDSGIPLVRYHIADEGGVLPHRGDAGFCARHGFAPARRTAPARSSTCSAGPCSPCRSSGPTSIRRTSRSASSSRASATG